MPWKEIFAVSERHHLVKLVRDGISVSGASRALGISRKTAYKCSVARPGKTVRKKRPRCTFTPAFKAAALRLCRIGGRIIAQVAKDLDLTETILREWVHRADVDAGKGPPEGARIRLRQRGYPHGFLETRLETRSVGQKAGASGNRVG